MQQSSPEALFTRLQTLSRAAIAHPIAALVALLLLSGVGAVGLLRLEMRMDGHALVPRLDPVVIFDDQLRADFGIRDPIVIYLDTGRPDGVFDHAVLTRIAELSNALATLEAVGVDAVTSLATEKSRRVRTGTLDFRTLLDPMPDSPERMQRLRDDIDAIEILDGVLLNADRSGTAILVGAPAPSPGAGGGVGRSTLVREIERLVALHTAGSSLEESVAIVGAPVAESLLGVHILEDLALLLPLALAVVAAVVWLACRRAAGVLLVLGEAGLCVAFSFGVMGWLGIPVYLTTAVLPVILVSIGIADELHILLCFQRELAIESGAASARAAAQRTMDAMLRPVTITSLTTAVGFLSFLAAPIPPVSHFGAFAALGIGFCWLWSLVAMPAALTLLGAERLRGGAERPGGVERRGQVESSGEVQRRSEVQSSGRRDSIVGLFSRGFGSLTRHPLATLGGLGIATLVLALGTLELHVQDSWVDGFAPGSRMRMDTQRVDAALNGTHVLLAAIEWPQGTGRWPRTARGQGPLLAPEVLRAIERFEDGLRELPGVGGVLGPASHLKTVHALFMAGRAGTRSIPEPAERVSFVLDRFDQARGTARRREVFHDDLHRGVVTVLVKNANYRDTARIMEQARRIAKQQLAPLGAKLAFGGDLAVSQAMIPAIVNTQLGSLFLALLGATLVVAWLSRSLHTGLLAVAPTALAVLWLMGAMGLLAIPIGVATSTFCAITLGVGVDYAVHLLERIRRLGTDPRELPALARAARVERVSKAVREVAPAVTADAVAVSLGFGLLAFSQVPANARLGVLIAVALLASALLTLLGLSAFLIAWSRQSVAKSAA